MRVARSITKALNRACTATHRGDMAGAARWLAIADKLARIDWIAEETARRSVERELLKINQAIDAAEAAQYERNKHEDAMRDDSQNAIG